MRILSLFDGISCARVALERAGFLIEDYVSSEIDPYAMTIAQRRYPDTFGVGSIVGLLDSGWINTTPGYFDLVIGGSPCQDLSIAKKGRQGLAGKRSGLFYKFVEIKDKLKPKWFILENVASMPKDAKNEISRLMGVEPIMINATLVSAQNRKRLFWTNIPNVTLPEDRRISLKDILEEQVDKKYFLNPKQAKFVMNRPKNYENKIDPDKSNTIRTNYGNGKSVNLSANGGGRGAKTGLYEVKIGTNTKLGYDVAERRSDGIRLQFPRSKTARGRVIKGKTQALQTGGAVGVLESQGIRRLTPIEFERLQGLPDNYTKGLSDNKRYFACGNAFNVDVVAHILSFIPKNPEN